MGSNLNSVIRAIILFGGGWLVNSGYISSEQLNIGIGAVTTLVPIAWSVWSNYHADKETKLAAQTGSVIVAKASTPVLAK